MPSDIARCCDKTLSIKTGRHAPYRPEKSFLFELRYASALADKGMEAEYVCLSGVETRPSTLRFNMKAAPGLWSWSGGELLER